MISANSISLQSPPTPVPAQAHPTAGRAGDDGGVPPATAATSAEAAPSTSGSPFRGVNLDIKV